MYKTTKMMAVAILASAVLANTSTSAQAARQHEHHEHQEQQEYVSSLEGAITANSVGQKQYKYINHLDIRINNAQFNIVIKNSAGQVISQQELDATVKAVKQVTINGVEVSADKQQDDSGGEIRADLDSVDVESITEIVIVVDLQTEQGVLENVRFVIPQGSVISLSVCPDGSGIDYEIAGWQETIKVEVNEEDVPEEILPPVVNDQESNDEEPVIKPEEEEPTPVLPPADEHTHETDYIINITDAQPGEVIEELDGKVIITISEDGKTYKIEILDKCLELEYVHDLEYHDEIPDGTGVVTDLPTDEEITIYINDDELCREPEPEEPVVPSEPTEPTEPTEPQEPSEPQEPQEPSEPVVPSEPQEPVVPEEPVEPEPEEPKVPEFLPETGLEGIACALFGTGLVGLGIKLNKKRK